MLIPYSFTPAMRSRVASEGFDIACGFVCSCQQNSGVSVCGCGWTGSPARVRQIGRRVYLGLGQFFFFFLFLIRPLPRGIEEWNETEIERGQGIRLDGTDGETGSITTDEIGLPCFLTLRPAPAPVCFLCQHPRAAPRAFTSNDVHPHLAQEHFVCLPPRTLSTHASLSTGGTRAALMPGGLKVFRGQSSSARKRPRFTNAITPLVSS